MLVNLNHTPLHFSNGRLNVRSLGTFDSPEDGKHENVSFQKKEQTKKKAHSSTPRTTLKNIFAASISKSNSEHNTELFNFQTCIGFRNWVAV